MHASAEFEPAIPASELPQMHAIDSATAGISTAVDLQKNYLCESYLEKVTKIYQTKIQA
jgi:hypothetical protein